MSLEEKWKLLLHSLGKESISRLKCSTELDQVILCCNEVFEREAVRILTVYGG